MSTDSPTEHYEHAEHAEHAAHEGSPFLLIVSVTIALLAVAAASVASLETLETAATLSNQNAATLLQNKASDQWAFFQAKSIKKGLNEIAAQQGGAGAAEFARRAQRYEKESEEVQAKAQALEHEVEQKLEEAERHEHRHHILTIGVTLLHISIAVTTMAIVMRGRRWPWQAGVALSVLGLLLAGFAYL